VHGPCSKAAHVRSSMPGIKRTPSSGINERPAQGLKGASASVRTLDAGDVALVLGLGGGLLLLGQLVHVQLRVGALELAVPALAAQVALLLRLLRATGISSSKPSDFENCCTDLLTISMVFATN